MMLLTPHSLLSQLHYLRGSQPQTSAANERGRRASLSENRSGTTTVLSAVRWFVRRALSDGVHRVGADLHRASASTPRSGRLRWSCRTAERIHHRHSDSGIANQLAAARFYGIQASPRHAPKDMRLIMLEAAPEPATSSGRLEVWFTDTATQRVERLGE
jgi:hypothetical protein